MLKRIKSTVHRFRREEEGTVVVEAIIIFPVLFAAVLSTFVFFDAFRNQSINLKAAYTISDALSRETEAITNDFMINSWRMHRFLTNAEALTQLRVTLIQYHADEDEYTVVWSEAKGGPGHLGNADLTAMVTNEEVPVMPDLETLILVQTWVNYKPNFSIGIGEFTFENMIFTRPRSAPNGICYSHDGTAADRVCPLDS